MKRVWQLWFILMTAVCVLLIIGAWQWGSGKDDQIERLQADKTALETYYDDRTQLYQENMGELQQMYNTMQNRKYQEGYQQGAADTVSNITLPEVITVNNTITKWQDREVIVTRTAWRDFESLEEFIGWLDLKYVKGDCDDYTEYIWGEAYKDGYRMSEQLVYDGKLFNRYVTDTAGQGKGHMGMVVFIGGGYYYFEPYPGNYRIIYICDRD